VPSPWSNEESDSMRTNDRYQAGCSICIGNYSRTSKVYGNSSELQKFVTDTSSSIIYTLRRKKSLTRYLRYLSIATRGNGLSEAMELSRYGEYRPQGRNFGTCPQTFDIALYTTYFISSLQGRLSPEDLRLLGPHCKRLGSYR
jgi:hypothetical protein